jgi:dihydrofolate reductase
VKRPIVTLVAAVAENGVIGRGGGLPWRLPDDLRHFQRLTQGHTVIMGRRTFDEIRAPLRGRRNIVVSRNPGFRADDVAVARSLEEALALARGEEEVFVVGGGEVYAQALPLATRMYLTHVHAAVGGDTRFPAFEPD